MNPITRMMKRYIKMPLKYALPLLFIGALVLASTTGCVTTTNTTNNQASDITKYPTTGHSALLSGIADQDKNSRNWESFDVTWYNNTAVRDHGTVRSTDLIMTEDSLYSQFPSVEAASNYFDSMRSQYPVKPQYATQQIYSELVTGKPATVFKATEGADGNSYLIQEDAVVCQRTFTDVNINQA
jgi:hypothetical protein